MRRTSIFLVGVLVLSSLGFALQTKASSVGPTAGMFSGV